MHAMFGTLIYLYVSLNLVAVTCTTVKIIRSSFKIAYHRAVIKSWGPGISLATMSVALGYFHRKIEEK